LRGREALREKLAGRFNVAPEMSLASTSVK
jgi:hypothetical protein